MCCWLRHSQIGATEREKCGTLSVPVFLGSTRAFCLNFRAVQLVSN